jgi:hypothetical protein
VLLFRIDAQHLRRREALRETLGDDSLSATDVEHRRRR